MKSKIEKLFPNLSISNMDYFDDNVVLKPNTKYNLTIDYPLEDAVKLSVNSGKNGWTKNQLLKKICQEYHKIYEKPEAHGIYGHSIGDLFLEEVDIYHDKKEIKIYVGA